MTAQRVDALKSRAAEVVESRRDQLIDLSHAIHANPETAWEEHEASALVAAALAEAGFTVERGAYGLATAVEGVIGAGDLTVAICAEYDSLPGIGHACGHNVIAAAGVGAALALGPLVDEVGLRVKLLGTPAEESGGGKIAMLRAGAWEDVDFSLMVHGTARGDRPAAEVRMLALDRFQVEFIGEAAHAATVPEEGRNAAAAATLAQTAIALLRQQLPREVMLNSYISLGGETINIIPDRTVTQVELRAFEVEPWRDVKRRVLRCFEGAAIATECTWNWESTAPPYAPLLPDPELARIWDANLVARGRTLGKTPAGTGSTDMGNVSQVVPAIHPFVTFLGETATSHNPAFADAAASPAADDAAIDGAIALAWTVLDVALDSTFRAELQRRGAARPKGATQQVLEV